ncbi:MAG: FliG C-terminal domain-containing protein [Spirochaetota bacterium]
MNEYQARLRAYQRAAGRRPEANSATHREPVPVPEADSAAVETPRQRRRAEKPRKPDTSHPPQSPPAPAVESSRERTVAILLRSLSSEEGAGLLRALPPDVSERIASRALTMEEPSDQEIEAAYRVIREIPGFSIPTRPEKTGTDQSAPPVCSDDSPGVRCAEESLIRAFGVEKARQIMSRSIPHIGRMWLSFLEELQPGQLSVLFARESLEVKALVIAHASPEVGSRIISRSGPEEQKSLVKRLARMREVPSDIVRTIADSLKERIRTLATDAEREIEGVSTLAEIMKHLKDDALLKSIEQERPELGQALTEELYSIEMVHRVRSRTLEDIMTRFDDIEIARLLKGKEESVRRRILEHVSENRALIISEEYRNLGPQLRSDVDALTHQFVLMLREADPDAQAVIPQT